MLGVLLGRKRTCHCINVKIHLFVSSIARDGVEKSLNSEGRPGKVYLAMPGCKVVGLTGWCPYVRCEPCSHGGVMQLCTISLA